MFIRVLTHGKKADAVDQAILEAIDGGHRVLVKVAASDAPARQSAGASIVADWADVLSQAHGLSWERVGGDILFRRSPPPAVFRAP